MDSTPEQPSKSRIGRYTILEELSQGGQAQVFLARREDGTNQQPCVLKLPLPASLVDERKIKQFFSEIQISLKLSHNNIVPIIDWGTVDGVPFYAASYIEGRDLGFLCRHLEQRGVPWLPDVAAFVTLEIAHALAHAHRRFLDKEVEIVHRDVKPDNVMVSSGGGVLLMDFGVAAISSRVTTASHVKGTLRYMSTEHISGRACPASDAFGLGAILWEMLAGKLFRFDIPPEALNRAALEGYVPKLERSELPDFLQEALEGLLAPDPEDRMTVAEFIRLAEKAEVPSKRTQIAEIVSWTFPPGKKLRTGHTQVEIRALPDSVQLIQAVAKAGVVEDVLRRDRLSTARDMEPLVKPSEPTGEHEFASVRRSNESAPPLNRTVDEQRFPSSVPATKQATERLPPEADTPPFPKTPESPTAPIPLPHLVSRGETEELDPLAPLEGPEPDAPMPRFGRGSSSRTSSSRRQNAPPASPEPEPLTASPSSPSLEALTAPHPGSEEGLVEFAPGPGLGTPSPITARYRAGLLLLAALLVSALGVGVAMLISSEDTVDEPTSKVAAKPVGVERGPVASVPPEQEPRLDNTTQEETTRPQLAPWEQEEADPSKETELEFSLPAAAEPNAPAPKPSAVEPNARIANNSKRESENAAKPSGKEPSAPPAPTPQKKPQATERARVTFVRGWLPDDMALEVKFRGHRLSLDGGSPEERQKTYHLPVGRLRIWWRYSKSEAWKGPKTLRVEKDHRHTVHVGSEHPLFTSEEAP